MLKQYTPLSNHRGFSILEVVVSMTLGMGLVGIALASVLSYRSLYEVDIARTQVSQSIRGGLDFMGVQVRQAGERLNSAFPAIELIDGAGVASDQFIVRKNMLDEVAKVCTVAKVTHSRVQIAKAAKAGCAYNDTADIYNAWSAYRTDNGGAVQAYIYDTAADLGEFFTFASETVKTTTPQNRRFHRDTGTWSREYPANSSYVYMIEEWKFAVNPNTNTLQVTVNGGSPSNIISDVTDLRVEIEMQDGTVVTSFGSTDNWQAIKLITITLDGNASVGHKSKSKSVSATFYPRNILSDYS